MSKVAVIMGSLSDWETMRFAVEYLDRLKISSTSQIISAHRTPDLLTSFARSAEKNGFAVIIAGAGGAAHLAGMLASQTQIPVLGVPVQSRALNGMDSLLSIVQMPAGIPVLTLAIGEAGAKNAALAAAAILSLNDSDLRERLRDFRQYQTNQVLGQTLPNAAEPPLPE